MNRITQLVGLILFSLIAVESSASSENNELWEILQAQPNLVVLMRHAQAKVDSGDPLHWDTSGNCKNERPLSNKGKEFARKLGGIFTKKNIYPFVISSPMCRTIETAKLAFGKKYITDPNLREIASANEEKHQLFLDKAKELLIGNRGDRPIVFISHRPNVEALSFELISVTELIVGRVEANGEIEVIGILKL